MRNISIVLLLSGALIAGVLLTCPGTCGTEASVSAENPDYVTRVNAYQAVMSRLANVEYHKGKHKEEKESGELERGNRYTHPEMFTLYDKMKRINPQTGQLPVNGIMDAWKYIQEEWGSAATEQTGNALQWDERGPNNVGGRTRALMWDPNDPQSKAAFAGGVGGGLWRNPDVTTNAASWVQVGPNFSNVAVTCIAHDPTNPMVMYYGTGEGWGNVDQLRGAGLWKSVDGGFTWNQLPATDNATFWYNQDIVVTSNGDVYAGTKGGLWRSENGGNSFTKVLGSSVSNAPDWITDLEIAGNGDLYVGIHSGGVYKSAASLGQAQGDSAQWSRLTGLSLPGGYDRVEVAVGQSNPSYLYVVCEVNQGNSNYFRSTNGGTSWSVTPGAPAGGGDHSNGQAWYDLCLEVDPSNHLRVYTGAIDQWRTANGGSSWTRLTAAYNSSAPYMHPDQHAIVPNPSNPVQVLFGNDGGVHYSSNRGSNPVMRNNGYNVTQFYSLAISTKPGSPRLIGGTQDNGSIMLTTNGIGAGTDLTGGDGAYCAINPNDPDTMFTTSQWETIYRTRNGGNNFNYIANPQLSQNNTMFINPMEIDPINPNVIYQASNALWRHGNANSGGSGSWNQVTVNVGSLISAITPSNSIPNTVYFASGGTVYRLTNAIFANQTTVPLAVNPSGLGSGYINCILDDPANGNHLIIPFSSYGLSRRVVEIIDADQGSNATFRNLTGNLPDLPANWVAFEPNNPKGLLVATDMGVFRCADYTVAEEDIYWAPASIGLGWPRVEQIKTRYSDNTVHLSTHGRGFFSTSTYSLAPTAAFAPTNEPACGGFVSFIDSSANVPMTWSWDFGDGGSSTLQSPMHQYTTSGTYTVVLIVGNPNGNDTTSMSVTVNVLPPVVAVAGPDQAACPGDTIYLSASGGTSYSWFPPAGLSDPNIANPVSVVAGNRTYVVTVTDANGCVGTDTVVVTQNAVPSVWAGQDQTVMFPNDSVQLQGAGADNYEWSPAAGLSCTSCPNPKAYPAATTTYTCTGTNLNGCSRSDNMVVTVAIVGVEDGLGDAAASLSVVSPNPVTDRARFTYQLAAAGEVSLEVVDLRGKTVARLFDGFADAGEHALDWNRDTGIAAGMYFLRLRTDGAQFVQRMLIAE